MRKMNEVFDSTLAALEEAKSRDKGKGFLRVNHHTVILVDKKHLVSEASRRAKIESYEKDLKRGARRY